jgi:HD superfamily phosphohydrolase
MEVQNLEKFEAELKTLLSQFKANVNNQNRNDYDRRMESNFTIRVPSSNFDQLFEALKPLAKRIENQSINLQDVTEQFIDVESRIKNRKALEDRYRELLKQAKDINDILTIERQLNQIRSEIESQEGRLKYLNDQVDMSTIQLNAFEIKPFVYQPEPTDGFGQQILKSLSDGWSGLIHGIIWIISLWPFALVIGFIVFLFKRRRKA